MLEIKSLGKGYYGKEVLKGIDLEIGEGEIVGLFGENGAGKTTFLKCILGLLPFQGEILLDGKKIDKSNIGRLSFATCEHSFFLSLTASEHREFYQMHFGTFREKRFRGLMDFFELPMNKALKHYSLGQKNQFEVIMALCQGADYILMDEPFVGRAILLRGGKIVGDVDMLELEEQGQNLTDYIKQVWQYRPDRVNQVLTELTDEV